MPVPLKSRKKIIKAAASALPAAFLIGNQISSQLTGSRLGYSPLLEHELFRIPYTDIAVYVPWANILWSKDQELMQVVPDVISSSEKWPYILLILTAAVLILWGRSLNKETDHGSAEFAGREDIEKAGLGSREDGHFKNSGVVVGMNPFTKELMLDNGKTHGLLVAPTRSGKGVNTVVPTGICWRESIFFFDPKGELWQFTSGYRKKMLKQKVLKFQPLCDDGSGARWNPLAEIDYRTTTEFKDLESVVEVLINPKGGEMKSENAFWDNSNASVLKGVILHLLYKNHREDRPVPCLSDVISFLSSPGKTTVEAFEGMRSYPHITPEEFLSDSNIFEIIYGEYVTDFTPFNNALLFHLARDVQIKSISELKACINEATAKSEDLIDWKAEPWASLLVHPTVADRAGEILKVKDSPQTMASIIQGTIACLSLYQNPIIKANTEKSDFYIRDLLSPDFAVSLYLVLEPNDVERLRPLSRLFISLMLGKLQRGMETDKKLQRRLLLMLDEFPQLKHMAEIENALAICAGYGIKIYLIIQNIGQINKIYTKDNAIMGNCHTNIFFTPKEYDTAEFLSKLMGDQTIKTTSHSDGGGLFKGSNTISNQSRKLMNPDEIMKMPFHDSLIFVGGVKPIKGIKIEYFKIPFFQERTSREKYPLPLISDKVTTIYNYEDLMAVHQAEAQRLAEKRSHIQEEIQKRAEEEKISPAGPAEQEQQEKKAEPASWQIEPEISAVTLEELDKEEEATAMAKYLDQSRKKTDTSS